METNDAQARKEAQRAENKRIGEDVPVVKLPVADVMSVRTMLARAVFVQKGKLVVVLPQEPDTGRRGLVLTLDEYAEAYIACGEPTEGGGWRSFVGMWRKSPERITVATTMLGIGRPRMLADFDGHPAVNLWTPRVRKKPQGDWMARASAFLDHMAYLIPVERERELCLDWMAHCEQRPQELPHYGWLMYTTTFGIGRNWLSSVLTRVWRGEVAASVNLPKLIASGFTGSIGSKRLAVVDEMHMSGGGSNRYTVENEFRSLLTEEQRNINVKYGREYTEWNAMRWLLFSNHVDALPLPRHDRRLAVVACPTVCRAPEYYEKLYAMKDDPEFIDAVGWWLWQRDISKFKPGDKPEENAAKLAVIAATTPQLERDLEDVLSEWQSPIAAASDLLRICAPKDDDDKRTRANFGMAMSRLGHVRYLDKVRVGGARLHIWVLKGKVPPAPDHVAPEVEAYRKTDWFRRLDVI